MKERLLTVCGQYKQTMSEKVPVLILKGDWFKDAGFEIGDRVSVCEENGRLYLTNRGKGYGKPYASEKESKLGKRAKKITQPTE